MSREPFIVPPGRNATLRDAWAALYGKPKKAKPEPTPAPKKAPPKKNAKPPRAKGGKPSKVKL